MEKAMTTEINQKSIPNSSALQKVWKGIAIYFRDYILFIKGSSIKILRFAQLNSYNWGLQTIIIIGLMQSYAKVNNAMFELASHLVHGGVNI